MRWHDRDNLLLIELHQSGLVPAEIAGRLGRSHRSVRERLAVFRRGGVLEYVRGRGRPPSKATTEDVDNRVRELDRARKQKLRARLVERSIRPTDAQAAILERARARGGFRSASALVRALLQGVKD